MIQLIISDMAGTTVKDNHEVEACFAQAAQQTGLNMTDEEILGAQGWAKRYVFETYWERQMGARNDEWAKQVEHSYQTFKEILEEHYRVAEIVPTDGTPELFEYCRTHGIKIALTTGFYRKVADIILERLGWLDGLDSQRLGSADSIIQLSITSDEVAQGRPAPDMIQQAMERLGVTDLSAVLKVGDTPSDLQAGKAAGVGFTFGLTNGTHTEDQLVGFEHDQLVGSMHEVVEFLKSKETVS
ncbi:HAD-IA family hydrolase [Pontibacter sp. G13]|uniref:HAD-IA family hydrolase n=1 Tax=Pontibacter sp. G13 TaxID=3074898 RepID=UPI00288B4711|nr:HAD-IA family hydrolase [Pontibacter sp. G13]WNJ16554.1 HAD-IA family hydrolase [Pontibacter sp. G13]